MHAPSTGTLRWMRAAYVTLAVFTVSIAAHTFAGGSLPTPPLLLVFALACCAFCAAFAGRRFSIGTLCALMATLEFLMHFALSTLSSVTPHTAHVVTTSTTAHAHNQDILMLSAHAVATIVLAALITSSDRTMWLIWSWFCRAVVTVWASSPITGTAQQALAFSTGEHVFVPTLRVASKPCSRRGPPRN